MARRDPSFRWPASVDPTGPAPVLNPVSPKAQTVINYGSGVDPLGATQAGPCPPTCSPMSTSVVGLGGVTQVLGGGGK